MNKALKLLIMYFVFAVAFVLLGTALYSLYLNIVGFSVGQQMLLFNKEELFKSFLYTSCIFILVVSPVLAYYRIRHRGGIIQFVVYLALSFATWFFLFPVLLNGANSNGVLQANYSVDHVVTAHYFRKADNKVFYLSNDLSTKEENSSSNAIVIDTENDNHIKIENIKNSKDFILFEKAEPYNDVLIKEAFGGSSSFSFFDFKGILNRGLIAKQKGGTFWLGFLSLAFALICVFALTNLFNWKLIDACIILLVSVGIFALNTFYYYPVFDSLRNGKIANSSLFVSLSSSFDDPVLVVMNMLLGIIFIVLGVIRMFRKEKSSE